MQVLMLPPQRGRNHYWVSIPLKRAMLGYQLMLAVRSMLVVWMSTLVVGLANRSKSTTDIYEFVPNQLADVVLKNQDRRMMNYQIILLITLRQILARSKDPKMAIVGLNLLKSDVDEYYKWCNNTITLSHLAPC